MIEQTPTQPHLVQRFVIGLARTNTSQMRCRQALSASHLAGLYSGVSAEVSNKNRVAEQF